MAAFKINCPHCSTRNAGFSVVADFQVFNVKDKWGVAGLCNICGEPVMVTAQAAGLYKGTGARPSDVDGDIFGGSGQVFQLLNAWPEPETDSAPDGVPETVGRTFVQGSASRRATHFDAACSMYRKAMELGLKTFSPDIEAWKIEKRIDKMAAEHRITRELQDWAHELRLDGNDALHGEAEATAEMAEQMHKLCWFLLTYLYTMPAQVAQAKVRRASE